MDERTVDPDVPDATPGDDAASPLAKRAAEHTHGLLAEHVPLALLVDLLNAGGPSSEDLLTAEGLPETEWWESSGDAPDPEA